MNARLVSDNKIQLKFRTRDFEGGTFTIPATYSSLQVWASDEADVQKRER